MIICVEKPTSHLFTKDSKEHLEMQCFSHLLVIPSSHCLAQWTLHWYFLAKLVSFGCLKQSLPNQSKKLCGWSNLAVKMGQNTTLPRALSCFPIRSVHVWHFHKQKKKIYLQLFSKSALPAHASLALLN